MVKVEVSYNPDEANYDSFRKLYDNFNLVAPTIKEFNERQANVWDHGTQQKRKGWTDFSSLSKESATALISLLLDESFKGIRKIEVNEVDGSLKWIERK